MIAPAYRHLRKRPLRWIRNAEVVIAYQSGKTTVQVGHEFGITGESVRLILRQSGVAPRPRLAPYVRFFRVVAGVARQQSLKKNTHGTHECYRAGCRCDQCRAAHAASSRKGKPYVRTAGQRARISAGKRGLSPPKTEEWKRERRAKARAHYAANAEQMHANQRAYEATHREERRAKARAYQAAHREERRAYARAYYAANAEKLRAKKRAYYAAHRDEILERDRASRLRNAGSGAFDREI